MTNDLATKMRNASILAYVNQGLCAEKEDPELELRKENATLKELLSETLDVIEENSRLSETIGRERVLPRNKGLIKRIKEVLK